jgi:FkbM family methyltransferase
MIATILLKKPNRSLKFDISLDHTDPCESNFIAHLEAGTYYEPDVTSLFVNVLEEGDTVIDVGGNIGWFTLLAATIVGPKGRVITFEPDINNLERLKNNITINNLNNITLIEKVVSDHVGEIDFYINSDDRGGHALWDVSTQSYERTPLTHNNQIKRIVECTTLDHELNKLGVSTVKLIKTDIEGADQLALMGASNLLKGATIPFIISEYFVQGLLKFGHNHKTFRDLMYRYGYDTFAIFADSRLPIWVPNTTELFTPVIINVLFAKFETIAKYWTYYPHQTKK